MNAYLAPARYIDSDHPAVAAFAARHVRGADARERAVSLYYAVRDEVRTVVAGPGPDRHLAPEIDAVVVLLEQGRLTAVPLDTVPLELPPTTFDTEAVWFVPRPHQLEGLEAMPLPKLLDLARAAQRRGAKASA